MIEKHNIFAIIFNIGLATIGAILIYCFNILKTGKKFSWQYFIVKAFIGMFVGLIVTLILDHFFVSHAITGAVAGLSGAFSDELIRLIPKLVAKKININITKKWD